MTLELEYREEGNISRMSMASHRLAEMWRWTLKALLGMDGR